MGKFFGEINSIFLVPGEFVKRICERHVNTIFDEIKYFCVWLWVVTFNSEIKAFQISFVQQCEIGEVLKGAVLNLWTWNTMAF